MEGCSLLAEKRNKWIWLAYVSDKHVVVMRLGRYHTQSKCPPRDERGLTIGRKTKQTDLIGLANVDGIDGMGWDWWSPSWGFRDLPLPQPQLRVFTSSEFKKCSVYCSSTTVILICVLPNEINKKTNSTAVFFLWILKTFHQLLFSCVVVSMYGIVF